MKYSVALCTFNGQDFITEQLESIFSQTIPPQQIVICDDRSDDDTVDIIRKIAENHPQIDWKIIVNEQNLGVVRNFEKAISLCDHEWVFLSDQDDWWLPEKAEKIFAFAEKKKKSVIFSDALLVDEKLESMGKTMFENIRFFQPERKGFYKGNNARGLLLRKSLVTGATLAFKANVVKSFFPVPENDYFIHDGWIATLAACINELGFVDEPLILYRQHANQKIGGKLDQNLEMRDEIFWEQRLGLPLNAKKTDRITASIKTFGERENVIYEFVKTHSEKFPAETLKFLSVRRKLAQQLLNKPKGMLQRLKCLSLKLYFYKLVEFQTFRRFLGNSFHYLRNS